VIYSITNRAANGSGFLPIERQLEPFGGTAACIPLLDNVILDKQLSDQRERLLANRAAARTVRRHCRLIPCGGILGARGLR
jgi:hypothetical protein